MNNLRGICTPTCSVFTNGGITIDENAQRKHIDTLLESRIHIIAAAGGTGEFAFLTQIERKQILEIVAKHASGLSKIIAHVSAVRTEEVIEYAKHAEDLGVDALLVLPPYFEGPTLEGVFEHYERIAMSVSTPIMAYNIPLHSGIDLTPSFCKRLMQLPNMQYLKDSTGDYIRFQDLLQSNISVFVGGEPIMFPAILDGATGCFWGTSNAIPRQAVKLFDLVMNEEFAEAKLLWKRLYAINRFIWGHPFNPSVKATVNLLGGHVGLCRPPAQPLSKEEMHELSDIIKNSNLTV